MRKSSSQSDGRDAARVEIEEAHAFGGDLEVAPDVARDAHPALRRRRAPHPGQRPRRRPGVPEVVPHQAFHALLRLPALAAEHLGHLLLQLVGQHVHVAAALEMQNRADALQELFGLVELPGGAIELGVGAAWLQQPDVPGGRDVAQAARRALDVGFELVDRLVERRVPLVDELQQGVEQPPPVVGTKAADPAVEALEEPLVAGDEADVEQRQQELDVAEVERRRLGEVREVPDVLTDGQAEIPQRLQQGADEALLARPHRVLEQEQQVDVGMEAERPPAVAPERAHRQGGAGMDPRRFRELLHERVHAAGEAGLHVPPAAAMPGGGRVFVTSVGERRARRRFVAFGA